MHVRSWLLVPSISISKEVLKSKPMSYVNEVNGCPAVGAAIADAVGRIAHRLGVAVRPAVVAHAAVTGPRRSGGRQIEPCRPVGGAAVRSWRQSAPDPRENTP